MNRFILVIFITLFLLPKVTLAHIETIQIKMSENGFEPTELSIHQNSNVEFINTDQTPRWPASDVHPIHSIYPQFDPKKAIGVGKSWKFQFKRAGVWKYHDHLLPHKKGEIIVTTESGEILGTAQNPLTALIISIKEKFLSLVGFIKNIIPSWQGKSALPNKETFRNLDEKQQFNIVRDLAKSNSLSSTWQYIQDVFSGEPGSKGRAHNLAHFMGGLIFEIKGFDGMAICTPTFAFGCYHGFLDQAFKDDLSHLNKAAESCAKIGQGGPTASCIHGIGHGVASFYKTSDLNSALASCNRLTSGVVQYCHDGVFMEFERNASESFYHPDDPLYPCNQLDSKYVFSCGRSQPRVMMDRLGFTFEQVAKVCSQSSDDAFQQACFDALGFEAVGRSQSNTQVVLDLCGKIPPETGRIRCIKSAAGELIFQDISGWKEASMKLCQSLLNESQKPCFAYIEQIKKDYGRI